MPIDSAQESVPPAIRNSESRLPELDGLRGIAVLMVLLTHFFCFAMLGHTYSRAGRILIVATSPGWLGVDLFFALSGFLITGILFDSKRDPHYYRNFYARRALRILPLYWLVILYMVLTHSHSGPIVLCGLLMAMNMAPIFGLDPTPDVFVLWSLAVEEHFYLLWPTVIRRATLRSAAIVCGVVVVAEPLIRAWRSGVNDVYSYSWFRFDGLAWGALIALLVRSPFYTRRSGVKIAVAGGLSAILIGLAGIPFGIAHRATKVGAALQFTPPEMLFAAILLFAVSLSGSVWTAVFRKRFLTFFGDLSYCIYVFHVAVGIQTDALLGRFLNVDRAMSNLAFVFGRAGLILAITVGLAAISRRYFELPILRFRKHFAPKLS